MSGKCNQWPPQLEGGHYAFRERDDARVGPEQNLSYFHQLDGLFFGNMHTVAIAARHESRQQKTALRRSAFYRFQFDLVSSSTIPITSAAVVTAPVIRSLEPDIIAAARAFRTARSAFGISAGLGYTGDQGKNQGACNEHGRQKRCIQSVSFRSLPEISFPD